MIQFDSQYVNNAHRISDGVLSATVTELYDGQWLMKDAAGEFVIHDGSAVKGYLTISSRYGNPTNNINRPITEGPAGRDNVTSTGRVSVLIGPYRVATDQYENGVYVDGAPLKISQNGKLMPCTFDDAPANVADVQANFDELSKVVAHVYTAPSAAGATMVIVHE